MYNLSINRYYMPEEGEDNPFICSAARENGMLRCHDVPPYSEGGVECSLDPPHPRSALIGSALAAGGASVNGCINWNLYYNVCQAGELNPHKGAVNFDNIGYAWIAIFQVRQAQSAFLNLLACFVDHRADVIRLEGFRVAMVSVLTSVSNAVLSARQIQLFSSSCPEPTALSFSNGL